MRKNNVSIGDTVIYEGKQGIVEAFHKGEVIVYIIEDQERHLAGLKSVIVCKDKYDEMVKSSDH
jgi:hypothetical protein